MVGSKSDMPKPASDGYIPPPMDPYATYQTPYERRTVKEDNTNAAAPNDYPRQLALLEQQRKHQTRGYPEQHDNNHGAIATSPGHQNPFIEFRRFADKQIASLFSGFGTFDSPRMPGMTDEVKWSLDESKRLCELTRSYLENLEDQKYAFEDAKQSCLAVLQEQRQDLVDEITKWKAAFDSEVNRIAPSNGDIEPMDSPITNFPQAASHPTNEVRDSWVRTAGYDGKKYYIERATGTVIAEVPSTGPGAMPYGWETKATKSGRPYYINHNERTTTWHDPRTSQEEVQPSKLLTKDQREVWRRGFRNCPELTAHTPGTELDVYEALDEQQQEDLAQLSHQIKERGERWKRGFQNCPELQNLDNGTELDVYKQLGQHDDSSAGLTKNNDKAARWWSSLGFDGKQRAQQTATRPVTSVEPSEKARKQRRVIRNGRGISTSDEEGQQARNAPFRDCSLQMPLWSALELPTPEDIIAAIESWHGDKDDRERNHQDDMGAEQDEDEDRFDESSSLQQWSNFFNLSSNSTTDDMDKPSIVSTMTRTTSRTLPDGSIETKRVLKQRFADGREQSEESTDISQAAKAVKQQQERPGWFWN